MGPRQNQGNDEKGERVYSVNLKKTFKIQRLVIMFKVTMIEIIILKHLEMKTEQ